jgi:hypothetical protein
MRIESVGIVHSTLCLWVLLLGTSEYVSYAQRLRWAFFVTVCPQCFRIGQMVSWFLKIRSSRFGIFVSHHWLTIAFALGFVTDFLLLNQIDNTFDNLILLFYVLLATASLLLFYLAVSDRAPERVGRFLVRFTPITMQYSFGGLLSGMLIFYGRSGDLITSAPFLLIIVAVILMNELVERRSDRLLYNVSV